MTNVLGPQIVPAAEVFSGSPINKVRRSRNGSIVVADFSREATVLKSFEPNGFDSMKGICFFADAIPQLLNYPWRRACSLVGRGEISYRKCHTVTDRSSHCGVTTDYCGKLVHDLRRTAARDLIRSGTPQRVAMKITGHATTSMFTRYNISDADDIREALRSMHTYRNARAKKVVEIGR